MPSRNDAELFADLKQYVALIGRGQKSGKTLSQAQARHLMQQLLAEKALPEQLGAILMLLRMREETMEELAGFLEACRDTSELSLNLSSSIIYDFGCYAGKRRHLPWFLLTAMALAETGESVFLHGLQETDSNRLYLDAVFDELGWQKARSSEHASEQLATHGFTYMSIEDFHPAMTALLKTRHILGLRSCLHSLSKMLNPAQAVCSIHGIFHRDLDTMHIQVAKQLQEDKVACIRGDSGEVEATPEKAFEMHSLENGEEICRSFPPFMAQWAFQTRQLGAEGLKQLWTGENNNPYGEQAVLATLTVALACRHSLSFEDAKNKAQAVWAARSGVWPTLK